MKGEYDSSLIGPSEASTFRSSDQIRADVEELIAENDDIHPKNICVDVQDGRVTLIGRVDGIESADEAVRAAREVLGVTEVRDELDIGE
jgi:osmotically-inducible protein OsmY